MRKLSVQQRLTGFFSGVSHGMNATNDVFDVPFLVLGMEHEGIESDRDAIRADVRKAKEKYLKKRHSRPARSA